MLARELKIKTLKKQREFIKEQLSGMASLEDGNTAYRYVGHVYPEVIKYFEQEGFVVKRVQSDMLTMMTKGLPVYVFTVDCFTLTKEELLQAEAYEPEENDDDSDDDSDDGFIDFLDALMTKRSLT